MMSAQIVELLVFAFIAFLIINKLIATLGTTSDEDPAKHSSYFGETKELKDVTATARNARNGKNIINVKFNKAKTPNEDELRDAIVAENYSNILDNCTELYKNFPSFNFVKFLRSTKMAFGMIIESYINNSSNLDNLVDKRYIEQFKSIASNYGNILNNDALAARVSDLYMFGNNVFIKVLFTGENVTSKINNLKEEWTFTKSLIQSGNDWHLTNIDHT